MLARENPFAVHRVLGIRYRMPEEHWAALDARLAALGSRGAIVGPPGRGKTTLLEALSARWTARGLRVRALGRPDGRRGLAAEQEALLASLSSGELVTLDSAEALSSGAWRRVLTATRAAAGFVIATHPPARLPVLAEPETTPALLSDIVEQLAGPEVAARLPPPGELFARHGGNVRTALRELYDYCAGMSALSTA
ncbi:MAG: hypothetical protein ABR576_03455 [Thermoanaerobaculia bacterium]